MSDTTFLHTQDENGFQDVLRREDRIRRYYASPEAPSDLLWAAAFVFAMAAMALASLFGVWFPE